MTDNYFVRLTDDQLIRVGLRSAHDMATRHRESADVLMRTGALQQETNCHILAGQMHHAERNVVPLLDNALQSGTPQVRADAWITRGRVDCLRGAFPDGCTSLLLALDISETDTRHNGRTDEHAASCVLAWGLLATSKFLIGEKRDSMNAMRNAYTMAMDSGHPQILAGLHTQLAEFHQLRGEPDQARDAAMEAIALAEKHDLDVLLTESSLHYWIATGTIESSADAPGSITALLGLRRSMGVEMQAPYFLYGLAQVRLRNNDVDGARDAIDEAIDIAMMHGERGRLAMLLTERARIRLTAKTEGPVACAADAKKAFYIAATQKARHLQNAALSLLPTGHDDDTASVAPVPTPC